MLNFVCRKKGGLKFALFYTFFTNNLSQKGYCAPSVCILQVNSGRKNMGEYRQMAIYLGSHPPASRTLRKPAPTFAIDLRRVYRTCEPSLYPPDFSAPHSNSRSPVFRFQTIISHTCYTCFSNWFSNHFSPCLGPFSSCLLPYDVTMTSCPSLG